MNVTFKDDMMVRLREYSRLRGGLKLQGCVRELVGVALGMVDGRVLEEAAQRASERMKIAEGKIYGEEKDPLKLVRQAGFPELYEEVEEGSSFL